MFTILPLFLLGIKALRHSINPRQLWLCSVPIGPSKLTKPVRPMNFPQEGNPPMIPKWLDHDTIRIYQVCHREHVLNMSYFSGKRQLPTITADCRSFSFRGSVAQSQGCHQNVGHGVPACHGDVGRWWQITGGKTAIEIGDFPTSHVWWHSWRVTYPIGSMYAIYDDMDPINIPQMLTYIPAPWILWV